jgi:hypothetical protein
MPFSIMEALADLQPAVDLFNAVEKAVTPKPTTAAGWVGALGLGSVLLASAQAYDALKAGGPVTLDEVVQVLGLPADGVVGKVISLAKTVMAQVKD